MTVAHPLNENAKSYPLKEIYERGELGINEIENRCHWFAAHFETSLGSTAVSTGSKSVEIVRKTHGHLSDH